MSYLHAIILAIAQGISELFPVSSLGHAVLIPKILKWSDIHETKKTWLAFLVALHVGTASALLIYFRDEWMGVARAFIGSVKRGSIGSEHDERLAWMVILGTIPAGLVGFLLENPLRSLFGSPFVAATFLVVNGLIMLFGELLIQRQSAARNADNSAIRYRDITELSWTDAAIVGFAQIGALIPGISRSGITMVAGLTARLTHEAAARYAFLLATPIIGAAGLLELPLLFGVHGRPVLGQAFVGAILAGVAAYISVRFLMRYFQSGRLFPFAFYCIGAGTLSLVLLTVNV